MFWRIILWIVFVTTWELVSMRSYTAIVERCQDTGFYVGFIPGFQGAHTQAETLDELNQNLRVL